jgi:hypothetical protein
MAITQIRGYQIKDREISSAKIALNAVVENLLADASVSNRAVADSAITAAKISDANVTTAKIADGHVTAAKLGVASVTGGSQLADVLDFAGKSLSGSATFLAPVTIAEATENSHAATKAQVDAALSEGLAAVAALGNALNLVSDVSGGADVANATDLGLQTEKDAGDTYHVTTAGYFKVDSNPAIFANIGDNLVFKIDGDIFKIDNTNSTVAGTTDFITVTGSTDTGYTVDIHATMKSRVSAAESAIGTVASLTTTASDLAAAINEHETDIGTVASLTTTATDIVSAINELDAKKIASTYTRETLSGTLNGTNTIFTIASAPIASTVQIYVNGVLQEADGEDYTLSGQTVTFASPPVSTDKLRAIYFKA